MQNVGSRLCFAPTLKKILIFFFDWILFDINNFFSFKKLTWAVLIWGPKSNGFNQTIYEGKEEYFYREILDKILPQTKFSIMKKLSAYSATYFSTLSQFSASVSWLQAIPFFSI